MLVQDLRTLYRRCLALLTFDAFSDDKAVGITPVLAYKDNAKVNINGIVI